MKKYMFFVLCLVLMSSIGFAEKFSQKVGVSIDDLRQSVPEEVVLKALISDSESIKGIYILWDDSRDLKEKNIDKLNAQVRLEIVSTNNEYSIVLYEIKDHKKNRVGEDLVIAQNLFVTGLSRIVRDIQSRLKNTFPPRDKKQLKEIQVQTTTLSQFEPALPTWVWGLNVDYLHLALDYKVSIESNGTYNYTFADTFPNLNLSPILEYYFKNNYMKIMLSADTTFEHLLFNLDLAKGIAGSVLMIGFTINSSYTWQEGGNYLTMHFGTNSAPVEQPSLQYWYFSPGIFLKLNITPSYSLQLRSGTFPFGDISLYYSDGKILSSDKLPESEGPAFFSLDFTFKVNTRLRLNVDYYYMRGKLIGDNITTPKKLGDLPGVGVFEFSEASIGYTYFGLGVRYEF